MRRFVGFYWTLQVPWAGFIELSTDMDEAARQSRTIAFQRALAQRFIRDAKGALIAEIAFLELRPDCGTVHGAAAITEAAAMCRRHETVLLWVDFSAIGWRDHSQLRQAAELIQAAGVETQDIPADELGEFPMRDDDPLAIPSGSPAEHFAKWKMATAHWRTKRDRMIVTELRAAIKAIPKSYGSNTRIADWLNERRVPTKTDGPTKDGVPLRRWNGDLVRKAIETLDDGEGEG